MLFYTLGENNPVEFASLSLLQLSSCYYCRNTVYNSINMNINTRWILFLVKVGQGNVHACVNVTTEVMSIFVGSFPHGFTAESLCSGGFHWHGQTALTQLRTLCVCLHVISTTHSVVILGKLTVMSQRLYVWRF